MGEDQDAAGARGLDEAHRGDGLARARRVLEPEPARRRPGPRAARAAARLLVGLLLGGGSQSTGSSSSAISSSPSSSSSPEGSSSTRPLPLPLPFAPLPACRSGSRRAGRSACPTARRPGARSSVGAVGQMRLVLGEQPLEAEHQRVLAPPLDRRLVAARRRSRPARRRARGGAPCPRRATVAASSPSCTNGSSVNSSARRRSSPETDGGTATEVLSAMRLWVLEERRTGADRACRTGRDRQLLRPVIGRRPRCGAGGGVARPLP